MRKTLILISGLLLADMISAQPCAHQGIGFYTQEQINHFHDLYPNCKEIQGDVIISGSDILYLEPLIGLTAIDGYLEIVHTDMMFSIRGLDSLRTIGGHFDFYANASMTNLKGLGHLVSVGGDLEIFSNPALTSLRGLDTLQSVGRNLWISSNPVLDSLKGLTNLASIEGLLQIDDNTMLTNLKELGRLMTIGGDIYIYSNPSLKGLSGLDSINAGTITGLHINNNDSLSLCDVYSICRYLEIFRASIAIFNNRNGCNNRAEVQAGCDTLSVQNLIAGHVLSIYPNPASCKITIETSEQSYSANLSILTISGQELLSQTITQASGTIDVGTLLPGVYVIRLVGRNTVETRKMLKE